MQKPQMETLIPQNHLKTILKMKLIPNNQKMKRTVANRSTM